MRKVQVSIPGGAGSGYAAQAGSQFIGAFHQFSADSDGGVCGIIEHQDGSIFVIPVQWFKFIEPLLVEPTALPLNEKNLLRLVSILVDRSIAFIRTGNENEQNHLAEVIGIARLTLERQVAA